MDTVKEYSDTYMRNPNGLKSIRISLLQKSPNIRVPKNESGYHILVSGYLSGHPDTSKWQKVLREEVGQFPFFCFQTFLARELALIVYKSLAPRAFVLVPIYKK